MVKLLGWLVIVVALFLVVRHYSPETAGNMKAIGHAVLSFCQMIVTFTGGMIEYAKGIV